ncbi:hypothetical protein F441_01820 [Phytophthora nicotianae CJ01A1]|uniref:BZIP domain-containing protein n=3 Tax=Phytophthora nicotianae TaxID=4792 RepID=W2JS93_PHYNI|nr:hypothetical protein L915_01783 [Phytophthora nicotianae]ETL48657.1 hypothetical protein L916_01748 [Phytophthora nicotianae]ETP25272.1 hypothetical protein F441_01820 [Phytophthora nicotianae CJ01A1]
MDSSPLFAPNCTLLSDKVITGVVQRVAPLHGRFDHECSFIAPTRLPPLESLTDETQPSPTQTPVSGRKLKILTSRRERCRINQARYRKRQRQHAEDLNDSIRQLKEEIQDLEIQKHNVSRSAPTDKNVWVVATEYFRHFRHGYNACDVLLFTSTARTKQHLQLDFLKATMAPEVTDGDLIGAEVLLESWRRFSLYHGDVNVELTRLEQVSRDSLFATTQTSITITQNTLRFLYPHLVNVNDDSHEAALALKLLDQRLVVHGSVWFDWDSTTGRVVRLESKLDLLTAMLRLLGDLESVVRVFDEALITLDGRLVAEGDSAPHSPKIAPFFR